VARLIDPSLQRLSLALYALVTIRSKLVAIGPVR
jgi:hypothetical protein